MVGKEFLATPKGDPDFTDGYFWLKSDTSRGKQERQYQGGPQACGHPLSRHLVDGHNSWSASRGHMGGSSVSAMQTKGSDLQRPVFPLGIVDKIFSVGTGRVLPFGGHAEMGPNSGDLGLASPFSFRTPFPRFSRVDSLIRLSGSLSHPNTLIRFPFPHEWGTNLHLQIAQNVGMPVTGRRDHSSPSTL
ncbi:hypothetical protein GWK47_031918 [Chionoecetes opilio]|uniref:Uncharacterized protein n=1 Tax=Chionoecetes opilio TaxID=41210 RepID=A0A8J4YK54_CHIOP|nr:hypothetical protein GWK47_031918 [Chionoecetes opilio]